MCIDNPKSRLSATGKEIILNDFDRETSAKFLKIKDESTKCIYLTTDQLSQHSIFDKPMNPSCLNLIYIQLSKGMTLDQIQAQFYSNNSDSENQKPNWIFEKI